MLMMEFYAASGPRLMLDETSVFDIGSCVVDGVDISPGRAIPDDGDPRIDHSLEGFLFTCGPDHIRHPEPVEGMPGLKFPLHGSFSASPAKVTHFSIGERVSRASALISVRLASGSMARLERSWEIDGETGVVTLADRVTNNGSSSFPAMLMYHMNIGAKYLDAGVRLSGAMFHPPVMNWTFGEGDGTVFCVPAGSGVAAASLGPIRALGGKTLSVSFDTAALPFLQMWRNQSEPANVVGIEPASHDWKSRTDLAIDGAMSPLAPGESQTYGLSFAFL